MPEGAKEPRREAGELGVRMIDVKEPQHRIGIGLEDVVVREIHFVAARDEGGFKAQRSDADSAAPAGNGGGVGGVVPGTIPPVSAAPSAEKGAERPGTAWKRGLRWSK